jgi:hypothetical protein
MKAYNGLPQLGIPSSDASESEVQVQMQSELRVRHEVEQLLLNFHQPRPRALTILPKAASNLRVSLQVDVRT